METLIITHDQVYDLLPMGECVGLMERALKALSRGEAVLPLRSMVWLPDRSGLLGLMPGYLGEPRSFGLKVVSIMPGNHGGEYDSHQGVVLLFGVEHGEPIAVIDASSITAIRTAAVSGVATRVLARADAGDLAILGSGVQATSHLEAMRTVRTLRRVRVWSRTRANALGFADRESKRLGISIEAMDSPQAAVEDADLICTTTAAKTPVLEGRWIPPGAHVNAVGACFKANRELDTAAVKRARLYVDRRESALNEAGDFLLAKEEGAVDDSHILGELGDVLLGRVPGRTAPEQVTLFESLGVSIEDLAAAHRIHRRAIETGTGVSVAFAGRRTATT